MYISSNFKCQLVLLWAQLTKIYPLLPTSVQPISITKTLLIVPTKNERDPPLFTGKLLIKFQTFWETLPKLSYDIGYNKVLSAVCATQSRILLIEFLGVAKNECMALNTNHSLELLWRCSMFSCNDVDRMF